MKSASNAIIKLNEASVMGNMMFLPKLFVNMGVLLLRPLCIMKEKLGWFLVMFPHLFSMDRMMPRRGK